jgi:pimeloyl-ACP methyl ester carboxylesterase
MMLGILTNAAPESMEAACWANNPHRARYQYGDSQQIGAVAPTMFIVGDHDFIRPEHTVQMLRPIPDVQLAIFPGAGHDAIIKRHEDVLARVMSFLNVALPGSETSAGE